jgi:acyl-CoA synthetase (AMP-forming)/AMP-acid ligase II
VGISHHKYGEIVGAFLKPTTDSFDLDRPTDEELRIWVRMELAWHKAPVHFFWLDDLDVVDVMGGMGEIFGEEGVEMPQTGSGKVKKHVLRKVADIIVNGAKSKDQVVKVEEDLSESIF